MTQTEEGGDEDEKKKHAKWFRMLHNSRNRARVIGLCLCFQLKRVNRQQHSAKKLYLLHLIRKKKGVNGGSGGGGGGGSCREAAEVVEALSQLPVASSGSASVKRETGETVTSATAAAAAALLALALFAQFAQCRICDKCIRWMVTWLMSYCSIPPPLQYPLPWVPTALSAHCTIGKS